MVAGGAVPARAASFDCAKASTRQEKLICADPSLSEKDEALANAYAAARAPLSDQGRKQLLDSQRSWLAYWPIVCFEGRDIFGRDDADASDPAACALAEYEARLAALESAVETHGRYRFLRTLTYTVGELGGINYSIVPRLTLDAPRGRPATRFNANVAQWVNQREIWTRAGGEEMSEGSLSIYNQEDDFVGVAGSTYQYYKGGAHGGVVVSYMNVDLAQGTPIDAATLFAPGSGWAAFLAARAKDQIDERVGPDGYWRGSLTPELVSDPSIWQLQPEGLELTFGQYSIGPYAIGILSADIGWGELHPYLAASAPSFTKK